MDDESVEPHLRQTVRLVRAAKRGDDAQVDMQEVQEAIEMGADIDGVDPLETKEHLKGFTALSHAAYNGDVALARFLLQRGADANARDALGEGALHQAAALGLTQCSIYIFFFMYMFFYTV